MADENKESVSRSSLRRPSIDVFLLRVLRVFCPATITGDTMLSRFYKLDEPLLNGARARDTPFVTLATLYPLRLRNGNIVIH